MRSYLMVTAVVFGLIVGAHVWRIVVDGVNLARDPAFILLTILAAILCGWALALLGR